ncbi:MAG: hypothetical protein ACHP9Z_32880, partial [Streptosporangiales bacterium]
MTSPWRELCGLDAYQITEIPRWPDSTAPGIPGQGQDPGRPGRVAALVAAYHAGGAVAYGWMRLRAGGPIQILAAGSALAGSNGGGNVLLALPGGARGHALGRGALAPAMSVLACWRAIGGISDGLLMSTGEPQPGRQEAAPSLEECLRPAWAGPFGWIVVAEPLSALDVEWLADDAARRERLATGMADRFPERDVEARRLRHRHTELRQGLSTGMWRVHLLAGGADPAAATRVAGLVCATADHRGRPYKLAPARTGTAALRDLLGTPAAATTTVPTGPAGHDARETPAGDTPRTAATEAEDGGGKSQTVRGLLEAASQAGVPWLVVEPAKAEYRLMTARLAGSGAEVVRIRPGEADAVAAGLNPLEPAADETGNRFPLQTHADLVRALFLAAFQSEEPFPQVLSAALTRVYEDAGWDLALGEPRTAGVTPGYPGLADLQRTAGQVVGEIGYSEDVKADVHGFVTVRLSSLRLGTTGRFLEGGHPVDFGKLLRSNAVLEIEDVGDDRDKAFLMGTVLLRLVEHLRLARRHETGAEPGLP